MNKLEARIGRHLYRHRLIAKRAVALLNRVLPRSLSRPVTTLAEKVAFNITPDYQSDTLPPIFNYWSNTHLRPKLEAFGFSSPEDFFRRWTLQQAQRTGVCEPLSLLSLGSGAAHFELGLLQQLCAQGVDVTLECVDFNRHLKDIAEAHARELGVADRFVFTVRDCHVPGASSAHDVVIVNQFFHHVEKLDVIGAAIRDQLKGDGVLLTSDVIGRNGHVLWPTVDKHVQTVWRQLPERQRFDRYFSAAQAAYKSVDHASYSNEGIRAQEIVASLLEYFDFELFVSYGGMIMPFIERRIGFNFSPDSADDRRFIDELEEKDNGMLLRGEYPASNMIAALRPKGCAKTSVFSPVSPEKHVALTLREASPGFHPRASA